MEYGLGPTRLTLLLPLTGRVLILVLMEYGLGRDLQDGSLQST